MPPEPQDQNVFTKPTPTARPEPQDRFAPTTWGGGTSTGFEELEVPSGQMCLVRRPGVQGLIKAGVLMNVDSLTSLIANKFMDGGKITEETTRRLANDPEAVASMTRTIDLVVCHIVVKPQVHMTPDDVTNRQADRVYCDTIEMTDRVFLFNFAVGGVRDLERFRRQLDGHLAALAPVEAVGDTAERTDLREGRGGSMVSEPGGAVLRTVTGERTGEGG